MQTWQLPEHIADVLPTNARQLESAREQLLALFRVHGYELVQPPLMEYAHSLLTHIDAGLSLKTILVTDRLSGRQLGIRADITPQVARIDAHLLSANQGINRLCYVGPVLHAQPDGLPNMREPLQAGAEMYGFADIRGDIELIDLMLKSMKIADMGKVLLSLGHIGIFRALSDAAHLDAGQSAALLVLMQDKDTGSVEAQVKAWKLDGMWAKAFSLLPRLYGGREVLSDARGRLPDLSAVGGALDELQAVCDAFPDNEIHIDLSELRVDNYHTGLLYAAYAADFHDAVARGGRYDGLGGYFGRARPATGFSFDLRSFIGRLPAVERQPAVSVDAEDAEAAREAVEALREQGQCVVIDYGIGHNVSEELAGRLKKTDGVWQIVKR